MKTFKKLNLFFLSLILLTFYNCNDDSNGPSNGEPASITIKLVDGPGDYDKVVVEVIDVMIKMNDDSEDEGGWESVGATGGSYDLLELTGGQNAVLVQDYEVLAGELSQIRLVLGENNYVVKDDVQYDLKTPSAQQSGLKLKVNQTLEAGFLYSFVLDFDVDKSIVDAGNSDNIILKPVIYASLEFASGIVQGAISPADVDTMISAEVNGETYSTMTGEGGVFMLYGIPEGTYDLTITPDPESGYLTQVVSVEVVNGQITDIGTIELQMNGAITGTILNAGAAVAATVSVTVGTEVISADTDANGVFLLENIPPGTYTVTITPVDTTLTFATIEATVISGETLDLMEINPQP
ncbi:DUF4382 domain-containing protein [Geojedonia litorea]|uniref:DUF4382 domain-containing protein n=1 Tax=Geojedonia litorea TaxID=1268269 RepID=A0ABV9N738_9FLAO